METIDEQSSISKCEMSITTLPARICIVGAAVQDATTIEAAESFGVPVILSETGLDIINDNDWRTHYVLQDFEGPIFDAIHKAKQCILGPPALKYTAEMKYTLGHNTRPVYNYSMRGVVTCFTSIRKKDELTKLVNLIHAMGGCIKKDLNTKTTHLICNYSAGEKYQYAKTFRLTVVRPAWVYTAWEQRDVPEFFATAENFSKEHKLKAFEGQKICFFGFPAEEHQHMVDVLLENGGVPAELDDPECSHVVMPNTGAFFTSTTNNHATNSSHSFTNKSINQITNQKDLNQESTNAMDVDVENDVQMNEVDTAAVAAAAVCVAQNVVTNLEDAVDDEDDDDDIVVHFDERLVVEPQKNIEDEQLPDSDDDVITVDDLNCTKSNDNSLTINDVVSDAGTPKTSKLKQQSLFMSKKIPKQQATAEIDGIVLSKNAAYDFQECTKPQLSPILNGNITPPEIFKQPLKAFNAIAECELEMAQDEQCDAADTVADANDFDELSAAFNEQQQNKLKRKLETSFDNVSLMSIESCALPASAKKQKLLRTGSFKRTIKRSMSFVADRTPILKTLRTRRSSIAAADASAYLASEADDSISSLTSINNTFNESIRKPVKKLRNICARVTRSASKREKQQFLDEENEDFTIKKSPPNCFDDKCPDGFKTPKAPLQKFSSTAATASGKTPKSAKRLFAFNSNNSTTATTTTTTTPVVNSSLIQSNKVSSTLHDNNNIANTNPIEAAVIVSTTLCTMQNNHEDIGFDVSVQSLTPKSKECPTMVVDEHTTLAKPEPKNHHTHILKSDWFWYTIQNGFANETDYLFGDYLDSIANTPNTDRRESLPISFNKRKRKRLSQRLQFEGTPLGSGKRRSSVSDAGLLSSVSNSFFDCTTSPDKLESEKLHTEPEICEPTPAAKKSMRFNHFMDFYTTESNYVGILDTILNLFKNKLEELAETNDCLLNKSEIKSIFGNFLPIHEVHQSMLEHLRALYSNWREDCLIGDIIIQHRDELIKAYPPYVNFYEQMKEQLLYCDKEYPRFHAFLKINQTKPECGRQSLQDLMIRPVQRLPSISLLLNDILKHTSNTNPDHVPLNESLKAIKEVTKHINEDKRRTESRMAIFDIFNDIEGCPAHLVSSNRSFISKCEANELSDCLSGRGDTLMLYLFSDSIEICKKRSRGFNTAKSPSTTKSHKHIKLISLNTIRIVIDIADSPRAFALLQRGEKEKLYTFSITDEETDKLVYLKTLCNQMAEHACRTDADKMLVSRTSQELDVDISDVNLSTLSKAFKLAAKTRLKVGRAFSFNKTPNKLKRAVSTMMTSPFGSTNSLTPATQLAQMRLASCTNIHEVADEDSSSMRSSSPSDQSDVVLVPPLSVQPTRKNKAAVGRM